MSAVKDLDKSAPVQLSIGSNGIKAEFSTTKGKKIFKNIAMGSLAKALNNDAEFDTGFLSIYGRNYIGVKRLIKIGDRELIFVEASPANRDVSFGYNSDDNRQFNSVRFPGLLMGIVCDVSNSGAYHVKAMKLYATRNPLMSDQDRLYRYPFGNVYDDAGICWGSVNDKNKVRNVSQAASLLPAFIESQMNSDLYPGHRSYGSLADQLESLQDASDYDYDSLRSANMNFRDLVSMFKNLK